MALETVVLGTREGELRTPSEAIVFDASLVVVVEFDPLEEKAPAELSKLAKSLDETRADALVDIKMALVTAL